MILTMETMKRFGVEAGFDGSMLEVTGSQRYRPAEVIVEGDWSGMANLLVAGSIAGDVVVNGLNYPSSQGDAVIVDILETCGAATTYDDAVTVQTLPLGAFDYDATDTPDLVPPLAVVAAYAAGTSRINGVHRLLHKESDRATALINEMTRLGIDIRVEGDALCISGSKVSGGNVDAHNDHRIAMALAVCALGADSPVTIEGADCVGKSYPDFFTHLAQLGARISMQS
jgi:3-phosphoshikimate 1-carboxyvinyltransferase